MTTTQQTPAQLQQRLDDLIGYIRQGKIIDAMKEFYTDDTVMEEPAYGKTASLAANIDREQKFVDSVKEWKGFDVLASGAGPDATFYECTMDWVDVDGNEIHVEQVCVQKWRGDKIVHERFYYNQG